MSRIKLGNLWAAGATVLFTLLSCQSSSGQQAKSPALELIDVIDAALPVGAIVPQFDLYCEYKSVREFGDEIVPADALATRIQFDQENEFVRWVSRRTISVRDDVEERTSIKCVEVRGNSVIKRSGSHLTKTDYGGFQEAVAAARVATPGYIGLVECQAFVQDPAKEIRELKSMLVDPSTTVRKTVTGDGWRLTARHDRSPGVFDVRTWDFRLPERVVIRYKLERSAIDSRLRPYWDQETFWESIEGRTVPVRMLAETKSRRRKGDTYEYGPVKIEATFDWLSIDKEIEAGSIFSNFVECLTHLEEGRRQAKDK